jgi:hypothetical protein
MAMTVRRRSARRQPLMTTHIQAIMTLILLAPVTAYGQIQYVRPIDWTRFSEAAEPTGTFGQTMTTILRNEARYELGWVNTQPVTSNTPGWEGSSVYYPQFSSSYSIIEAQRPLASVAYGTAVQIKTGIFDADVAGVSADEAIRRAEMAIRGVAFSNVVNVASPTASNCWGRGTVSALNPQWHVCQCYGSQAAEAAWLLWDRLGDDTKLAVSRMMEYQANKLAAANPEYWANRSGAILTPGDTQLEDDAWSGRMLSLAQAMMPNHPNAALWRQKADQWMVAGNSRQSDLGNTSLVCGKPVKDYLNGFNVFPDGVAVNHGIIHPDYMCDDRISAVEAVSLAGQHATQSMVFNADLAYSALTELQYAPGTNPYGTGAIRSPGGTMFRRTAGGAYTWELYYPNGTDWTNKVTDGYINTDLFAEYLGLDTGKDFDAMGWAAVRALELRNLQTRAGHDGNIYQSGDWYTVIRDTDEVVFLSNSAAWMQWYLMQNGLMSSVSDHWGALTAPEPSAAAMAITGLLGSLAYAWRRRKKCTM